jgi:hypothetical protein
MTLEELAPHWIRASSPESTERAQYLREARKKNAIDKGTVVFIIHVIRKVFSSMKSFEYCL